MQKSELGLSNPIDMVYHIQPWMTVSLLPLAVIMEGIVTIKGKKCAEAHGKSF